MAWRLVHLGGSCAFRDGGQAIDRVRDIQCVALHALKENALVA
jgi:hypothetical protein